VRWSLGQLVVLCTKKHFQTYIIFSQTLVYNPAGGLTPFNVVLIGLNTLRDLKDSSLDLMASSHMGQSLLLWASVTIVQSRPLFKCCGVWKQKVSSRSTYVWPMKVHFFTKLLALFVESTSNFFSRVIQLNAWKHTLVCHTYLSLCTSILGLKIFHGFTKLIAISQWII
jgi:hypothetical protein